MNRVNQFSKCINKSYKINNYNNNGLKQYQSSTFNYLSISTNKLIINNNSNNELYYQKRDISFFTNIVNNFKQLVESNPDYLQMMQDFDRVFLNNRFKKQKEKEEQEKKEMEEKMAAYSKSAEQRAREEASLSEEEIKKRRQEEQKLYEELLNLKSRKSDQQSIKMPSSDITHISIDGAIVEVDQEKAVQHLKDIYDRVGTIRPIPAEPNREEPTFEECQDFLGVGEFGMYDLNQYDLPVSAGDENYEYNFFSFQEQFDLVMESMEEVGKFLEETDREACEAGVKYDPIDWEIFIYTEEEFKQLPKPYLEFLQRKLDMIYGDTIKKISEQRAKDFEQEIKKLEEYENQEKNNGRELDAKDNPKHYPIHIGDQPIEPILKDPLIIRIRDKILDKICPSQERATSFIYDFLIHHLYRGSPINNIIIKNWDRIAPGTSLEQLLYELDIHFLPNFLYHFFRGNIKELEKYTDDDYMSELISIINELEGPYKILNHQFLGISKIGFSKFLTTQDGNLLKVTVKVATKVGYRDYNGNSIKLSREERHGVYITHFVFYLGLNTKKNRFGWVVFESNPTVPIKAINIVSKEELDEYEDLLKNPQLKSSKYNEDNNEEEH